MTSIETSKEQLWEQVSEKSTRLQTINVDLEQLTRERDELRTMGEEFRKESESILSDYHVCAQRLKTSQEETSRWTSQHQKTMTEMDRQKERVGLLEEQRRELEEKLSHMDQQVSSGGGSVTHPPLVGRGGGGGGGGGGCHSPSPCGTWDVGVVTHPPRAVIEKF